MSAKPKLMNIISADRRIISKKITQTGAKGIDNEDLREISEEEK